MNDEAQPVFLLTYSTRVWEELGNRTGKGMIGSELEGQSSASSGSVAFHGHLSMTRG